MHKNKYNMKVTCEIIQLGHTLHDHSNQRQIQCRHPGLYLWVSVPWVRVMAGEQIVYHIDDFLMQSKQTVKTEQSWAC